MVRVLLFGRLADVAGWRERTVDPAPATLSALQRLIGADDPQLAEALAGVGVRTAVDQVLSRGDVSLDAVKEVAFMPPMSGG
ncbi:MoaD/ThiS family protein [Phenylobacterium sp.]|uniref:MoaD/ThiS family protein n=1 Tax=Phenylobacterium sp. TaxID=1871053 RepID=UPI00121C0F02|nr:MoaD/ThiS family protein [Phenylobacterium sp.]THD58125.1 MAG: MoaD/ThiS family protein [Phenylobacterium sp.]